MPLSHCRRAVTSPYTAWNPDIDILSKAPGGRRRQKIL